MAECFPLERIVEAHEGLEHLLALIGRDARAVVGDAQAAAAPIRLEPDRQGAALIVPFLQLADADALVAFAARHALEPLALSPGGAETLAALAPPDRTLLLLGSEGPGLPPDLMARLRTVRIAMAPDFDSLNVATAAGIALHAVARAQGRLRGFNTER